MFSNIADWCHMLSLACLKGDTYCANKKIKTEYIRHRRLNRLIWHRSSLSSIQISSAPPTANTSDTTQLYNLRSHLHYIRPSKHDTLNQMPIYCWADVGDGGPTINRHWFKVSCLLGYSHCCRAKSPQTFDKLSELNCFSCLSRSCMGGGPRVVVSTAAFHARVRGSVPGLGGLKETKIVSSPSTCES